MLPRRTRERIFEPAFYDLLRRSLQDKRTNAFRFGGRTLGLLGESYLLATWRMVATRRFMIIAGALFVFAVVVILMLQSWLGELYGEAY